MFSVQFRRAVIPNEASEVEESHCFFTWSLRAKRGNLIVAELPYEIASSFLPAMTDITKKAALRQLLHYIKRIIIKIILFQIP